MGGGAHPVRSPQVSEPGAGGGAGQQRPLCRGAGAGAGAGLGSASATASHASGRGTGEWLLQCSIHTECPGSLRYAKGQSQTMSTLRNLVHKGVKVDLGVPPELWDEPSVEVTQLKQQCEVMLECYEEPLEDWYFQHQKRLLRKFLCEGHVLGARDVGKRRSAPRNPPGQLFIPRRRPFIGCFQNGGPHYLKTAISKMAAPSAGYRGGAPMSLPRRMSAPHSGPYLWCAGSAAGRDHRGVAYRHLRPCHLGPPGATSLDPFYSSLLDDSPAVTSAGPAPMNPPRDPL